MISIEEFCDLHEACVAGRKWAIANCLSMTDAWEKLPANWLRWVATRPNVLTDQELRLFAVFCARQVQHLLTDKRSKDAIDTAERYANGQATDQELASAACAAWAAYADASKAYAAWSASANAYLAASRAAAASATSDAIMAAYVTMEAAPDASRAAYAAKDPFAFLDASSAWAATRAAQADWLRKNTKPNFEVKK